MQGDNIAIYMIMAGQRSSCSHVAAVLFKLTPAVLFQLNTPTCSWKASRKSVQPATINSIDFSRAKKQSLPNISGSFLQVNETKHYSCIEPTKTRNPISNERLKDLYRIYPQAAIFTSFDVTSFQSVDEGTASVTCNRNWKINCKNVKRTFSCVMMQTYLGGYLILKGLSAFLYFVMSNTPKNEITKNILIISLLIHYLTQD